MSTRDLLIEVGTEELPPKALSSLAEHLADGIVRRLHEAGLAPQGHTVYATPRRLAVLVREVAERQPERETLRRGPAVQAAFDSEGRPSKALEGFARSCGVSVDALEELATDKGAWMVYRAMQPGQPAQALIPEVLTQALDELPIPKRMRWGAGEAAFVRPLHWIVLLFGTEVIEAEIYGVKSGGHTHGHRFHHPAPLPVPEPRDYAALLEGSGHVVADFAARRAMIEAQVEAAACELGGRALLDEELLHEVTALTEWPRVVSGGFEPRFLAVPKEALISTMQGHQRYFPLLDAQGELLPHFLTVANIDSLNPEAVRLGNERVIRPRFSDAEFFWREDRKRPLAAHLDELKTVVFEHRLGTLYDKTERVVRLTRHIAGLIGADLELAARAALLSKCDLMTGMVGEFPELQGIMGRYLALHDGEPAEVAQALEEAYLPRRAGDDLPASPIGQALALAERLDTLVGIYAVAGMEPSGAKDPFALRRAALGVLRILIEKEIDLDLLALLKWAYEAPFPGTQARDAKAPQRVFDFMLERLRGWLLERGIRAEVFDAVLAVRPTRPLDFERRAQAVNDFLALPQAEAAESIHGLRPSGVAARPNAVPDSVALAAANKRIGNILKKVEGELPSTLDEALLVDDAERELTSWVHRLEAELEPLFAAGDYAAALARLARLREPVDAFFDKVMVMTEDAALRANRLALLSRLRALFLRVADISLLGG